MKIGILGGTFNPIHNGHIYLAKKALKKLRLDKIIFVPSKVTPLRDESEIINARDRYNMVNLAIQNNDKFKISRYEIDKKGISYTVDTLANFRQKYENKTQLYFITGSDIVNELDKWKDFDKICKISKFVIAKRPNFKIPKIAQDILTIDIDALNISSSDIRKKVKNNQDFKDLVPDRVYQYINKKSLYRG